MKDMGTVLQMYFLYLNSLVPVPALALAVLQHWDVDDLQHARTLDLGNKELNQGTGHVIGNQGAPSKILF